MVVAGTCSYKATRDLIISTLELKFKLQITSISDEYLHIAKYKPEAVIPETTRRTQTHSPTIHHLQWRLNAPLQLPLTLFKHPLEHLINSRETRLNVPFEVLLCICPAYSHGHITPVPTRDAIQPGHEREGGTPARSASHWSRDTARTYARQCHLPLGPELCRTQESGYP